MDNKKLRSAISYLYTFFIAFFLFAIVVLTTTRFTIMSENYLFNKMDSVDYYEGTATQLTKIIRQNARPSGMPQELFDNYVQEEDIRTDMITYAKEKMNGNNVQISAIAFKDKMEKDVKAFIEKEKIEMNATTQAGIDQFVNENVSKYTYLTQFPYIDVYGSLIHTYQKLYIFVTPLLILVSGVLMYLVNRLHRSKRRRNRFYAYGCLGAGLLCSSLPLYLYVVRFFDKINLTPQYMYDLIVSIGKNYLFMNIMVGLIFIIIGILFAYLKIKKNKKLDRRVYPGLDGIESLVEE